MCGVDDLDDGEAAEFLIDGRAIALAKVGGAWFAIDNECPHAGGPLGDGELEGTRLACPWHGWGFDVTTGVCEVDPSLTVATFDVRVHDGSVWVEPSADR